MRNVVFVIWSLGLGGAEQVVIRLAAALDRRRFRPTVLCLNEPGPFAAQAGEAGLEVVALHKRGALDPALPVRLVRELHRLRADVVHTHLWGANLWGRLAARLQGVEVVVATEHNVDTWKGEHHLALDRILAPWTIHLVAVSAEVREFYEARAVAPGRWRVIHNGIALPAAPSRGRGAAYRALGFAADQPVVGLVGRLVPAKAPEVFLEAVARAARVLPGLGALVIGDGPLRVAAEEQARRLGVDGRTRFAGLRHDVPELLAGLDVLVFSSLREGLSIAMLEAMAAGVPVVATRVGGNPELIESGVSGFLVPPGDAAALAERVVALVGDPLLADAVRRAARRRVEERFSLESMVAAHEALYEGSAGARPQLAGRSGLDA